MGRSQRTFWLPHEIARILTDDEARAAEAEHANCT